MRSTRWATLLALAVIVGGASWVVLDALQRNGNDPLPVPWTAPAGLIVLAGVVLVAGWEVRRWVQGRRAQPMSPLTAARIAVLASASSSVGAVLTGWYAAQAVVVLRALVGERRSLFWMAVASALAAIVLAVAGLIGQRWCRRPPGADELDEPTQAA
ncbi:MAG: DUF3180 domain-containing protein [Kineosporiaceae bacterium]